MALTRNRGHTFSTSDGLYNMIGVVSTDADGGVVSPASAAAAAAVTPAHTTATATSTTGAMLAANANRRYALLQNDGSVDVYIKVGATAVASQGIRLLANGGSYEMSASMGNLMLGAVNGITASGSAVVLVCEGV